MGAQADGLLHVSEVAHLQQGQQGQQGQQAQQGQQGQPAKRDAQLFALAAALAEYRKQHGVEQGVEQPSADDEMPQAAG